MAVPFDLAKLAVTGGAVPVVEGVGRAASGAGGQAQFAVSASGTLAYVPGPARAGRDDLFFFDRKGNAQALNLPPGIYLFPRVSPDGKWLALETTDGRQAAVSLYELSGRSSVRRLTFDGNNRLPIWAPDSRHVAFQSDRDGAPAIFWQPVDGGPAERLTTPEPGTSHVPESWSPRSGVFLFSVNKDSRASLWTFSVRDSEGRPVRGRRLGGVPDGCRLLSGRPVGGLPGRTGRLGGSHDVCPAVPTDRGQVPDRARGAPRVVTGWQGAVLHPRSQPVHGCPREDRTDLRVWRAGGRHPAVRSCSSCESAAV